MKRLVKTIIELYFLMWVAAAMFVTLGWSWGSWELWAIIILNSILMVVHSTSGGTQ